MTAPDRTIAVEVGRLARALPVSLIESLAATIANSSTADFSTLRARVLPDVLHPSYRSLVAAFVDRWAADASGVSAPSVSLALLTAAHAEMANRDRMSVELVWTGPKSDSAPFRQTEQAILQVLDSAVQRITLVSYAVYKMPFIQDALIRAARRGVRVTIIIETPDRAAGREEYSTLAALGPDVASCCRVFFWPKEKRSMSEFGKLGLLHVKCAVADGRWLFLSSANLTEYAFTINMELGVLITSGELPAQVEDHFDRLRDTSILEPI